VIIPNHGDNITNNCLFLVGPEACLLFGLVFKREFEFEPPQDHADPSPIFRPDPRSSDPGFGP
jgi:hypothetical protein